MAEATTNSWRRGGRWGFIKPPRQGNLFIPMLRDVIL